MKHKPGADDSTSKVISFKNYKDKKVKKISSTIAAIIAIKIDHPSDISPEDFFVDQIETIKNVEILAFEDALENNNVGLTSLDAQTSALNDA
tara:strand:- start:358 stop:633 length:276 start_codon:yes stop_codon:yes gene_type:complete